MSGVSPQLCIIIFVIGLVGLVIAWVIRQISNRTTTERIGSHGVTGGRSSMTRWPHLPINFSSAIMAFFSGICLAFRFGTLILPKSKATQVKVA